MTLKMDSQRRTLPDYSKPPVNEVVLGVQFDALENFGAVHPGLFWQKIRESYPIFSVQPPIASTTETFGEQGQPEAKVQALLSRVPPVPRCWFLDTPENRLVQLQPDRFLYNWKKVTGIEDYPHYDVIFPEFKKQWQSFLSFAEEETLGAAKLNHWEVTYVNHIYQGEGWNDLGDLHKLFPILSNNVLADHLKTPENINLTLAYSYPDEFTRLHIVLTTAYRRKDNALLLQFKFTARGKLDSDDNEPLYRCLDFGHKIIVSNFTDLTSPEAHTLWERKV